MKPYETKNETFHALGWEDCMTIFLWLESNTVESYRKSNLDHIYTFNLHFSLFFNISCLNDFPSVYLDIFCNWKKYFSTNPGTGSCILSQYLWFNKFIIVDNTYVNFTKSNFLTSYSCSYYSSMISLTFWLNKWKL